MKPRVRWALVLLLLPFGACVSGQAPPPPGRPRPDTTRQTARPETEVKQQIADELAGLAEWCADVHMKEQGRGLVDEILFVAPRHRRALALQVPLAGDSSPAATPRAAWRKRRAATGRAVAPLYLDLFARRHRPALNALYDVYLIRALEHEPRLAAPVFEKTCTTALRREDWSRARMLLSQGNEYYAVRNFKTRLRDIDASEMQEIRRQIVPGGSFVLKFPELGPTVKKDYRLMQMKVVLPPDYTPDRQWPLYISFGGGTGSDRPNRLTDRLGFVATALPYPRDPRNLEQSSFDPVTLWSRYEPMLAKLEQVLPNLHPTRRVVFGFSNGANAITALVAFSDGEFMKKYRYLIIHEGGMYQRQWSDETWRALRDCSLLYSGGNRGSANLIRRMHQQAVDHGVDAELLVFEGGHEINPEVSKAARQWINRKVID